MFNKKNFEYEYLEDNGGGLHLFAFINGKVVAGVTNLEYAQPGEWEHAKEVLDGKNPVEEVKSWGGQMEEHGISPADFYKEMINANGVNIVCDNGVLYPSSMGRAAEIYFGIDND